MKQLILLITILSFALGCAHTMREYARGDDDNCTFMLVSSDPISYEGHGRKIDMRPPPIPPGSQNLFEKIIGYAQYPLGKWAGRTKIKDITELSSD